MLNELRRMDPEIYEAVRAAEKGLVASIPTTEAVYDLVIDAQGRLVRAQVKYAGAQAPRVRGAVFLGLRRTTRNKRVLTYSEKDLDVILAYIPQLDAIVWLPPMVWSGKSSVTLRYVDTQNCQKCGITDVRSFIW
jgi:hypothetical protein